MPIGPFGNLENRAWVCTVHLIWRHGKERHKPICGRLFGVVFRRYELDTAFFFPESLVKICHPRNHISTSLSIAPVCARAVRVGLGFADIGTSNKQWGDGKNWSDAPDACRDNVVRNNIIHTRVRQLRSWLVVSPGQYILLPLMHSPVHRCPADKCLRRHIGRGYRRVELRFRRGRSPQPQQVGTR